MNWQTHHAYRVFEEFLQSVVIDRRSYITVGKEPLDFAGGFGEIQERFVEAFDASDATFDEKADQQFKDARPNTRRLFANLEYLYAMPAGNISGPKKRSYALRWFADRELVSGRQVYFTGDDCIANPGMWYLTNMAKERDRFTCVACGFHYHGEIVQAHHHDPLSERKEPKKTKLEDLITLCPNCHYIAHFLLRKSARYKIKAVLVTELERLKVKA